MRRETLGTRAFKSVAQFGLLPIAALFLWLTLNARAADEHEVAEPEGYKLDDYRSPVPKTLAGARVIDSDDAEVLLRDRAAIFVDVFPRAPKPPNLPAGTVWRDPTHMTIEGAHWLPNVGYGVLSPDFENYFKTRLAALTGNDQKKPVVFFCLKNCWMSWNAGKRALSWGYANVIWFSEGTDAWQQAGFDLVKATPVP
ncbi:PQQ-dependent catabolism-associated CXXCW motif protein [Hyphomicrobium sp. LHD-15]|uniref:PQQ-dependent catabolism-associated CXXCW motif protein n=1 Tax=Hyphomicrobium sp. LHD-15 TaxID=3072142 RepID=UPI00280F8F90|nr:PQQ-dependent catabolism-associated CXXCW motif protein [Hyphomicrobium sp. LHD-15]MDQ8697415.1 PQQ-dependent catabolism-associated CXXCW motif protein [Hyphomicrobium sp. LHD-15]